MRDHVRAAGLTALTALVLLGAFIGGAAARGAEPPEERIVTQTVVVTTTATKTQTSTATVTAIPPTVTETPPTVTVTETSTTAVAQLSAGDWLTPLVAEVDPGGANWYFVDDLIERGRYAQTRTDGSHVQVDPDAPEHMRPYVVLHEYGHLLEARKYGNVRNTPADEESVADCLAVLMGWQGDLVYGCNDMEIAEEILNA